MYIYICTTKITTCAENPGLPYPRLCTTGQSFARER